jgi:hypothetical protein
MTDMTDAQWFDYCFRWWAPYAQFVLDNERAQVDEPAYIPPEGWVS